MRTYGVRAFAISVLELWNQLPDDIKSIDSFTTFKSKLKIYFLISLSRIDFSLNFILSFLFQFTIV